MPKIQDLISEYKRRRADIRKRLAEFSLMRRARDQDLFMELCFCILTANANALKCDEAMRELGRAGLIFDGSIAGIRNRLKGRVRFHNKKALFITGARRLFSGEKNKINIRGKIPFSDVFAAREWLVKNVKGLGYKEASHFLRNIGLGKEVAILDRHILRNLVRYDAIAKMPLSIGSRRAYLETEEKMRRFSMRVGIPLPDLDLLFWSLSTGFIFK
jgi:N-glycosylase/DNA lyase